MSVKSSVQSLAIINILAPVSCANTAAATSGWIDVRKYEGLLGLIVHLGAMTGSFTPTFQDATDGAGSNAAGITPNEGNIGAMTANTAVIRTFGANRQRGWIRVTGTIVTGPAVVGYSVICQDKDTEVYA